MRCVLQLIGSADVPSNDRYINIRLRHSPSATNDFVLHSSVVFGYLEAIRCCPLGRLGCLLFDIYIWK